MTPANNRYRNRTKAPALSRRIRSEAKMATGDLAIAGRTEAALKPRRIELPQNQRGAASRRLVVVSNRVTPTAAAKPDSGGLAVAIRSALQQSGGIWFGWSGEVV